MNDTAYFTPADRRRETFHDTLDSLDPDYLAMLADAAAFNE